MLRKMNSLDSIKHILARMGHLNHHLADELAKLPEIRKFKTDSSRLALDNLLRIYRFAPDSFDHLFDGMNTIGLQAHRKFCSPLQALFWLIQDENLKAFGTLLGLRIVNTTDASGNCRPRLLSSRDDIALDGKSSTGADLHSTVKAVLDVAWNGEAQLMLRSTLHQIIQRIQTQAEAAEYAMLIKRHSDRQLQSFIMDDFLSKKEIFYIDDWDTIEKALRYSRWKLFYRVADRLNSPEMISYYMNKYFLFRKTPASGVYFVFHSKKAQCTDAAYFAEFMLKRAGYKTFMRSVKWDEDPWDGLHTGTGIILDDGRYLLVANYTGINSIAGPFSNLESLDQKLSCGRKIIGNRWGAYYPPRFY